MPEPCKQEVPVASLTEAVKYLAASSQRSEAIQMETLETLKTLAMQGEQIKTLASRADRAETRLDEHAREMYPRLRALEDFKIKTDAFLDHHEEVERDNRTLSIYVKGGLVVAALTAVTGFLFVLYAHTNQPVTVPQTPTETRRR